ncbi:hypothetical protein L873DRAFT_959758 [Choiromyces venosus 120613-1]|uniref:Uncharacterized protein n=1 Tax=Choiromyces venosus 120613-1 TaxID=1336337 RepID=A0A3N4K3W6_9PEZI|nr:hypothetical protein L873DRAFT_959758 [Choiromyces venosus 120613-1]
MVIVCRWSGDEEGQAKWALTRCPCVGIMRSRLNHAPQARGMIGIERGEVSDAECHSFAAEYKGILIIYLKYNNNRGANKYKIILLLIKVAMLERYKTYKFKPCTVTRWFFRCSHCSIMVSHSTYRQFIGPGDGVADERTVFTCFLRAPIE